MIDVRIFIVFRAAAEATIMSQFGDGRFPFILDEVACTGKESALDKCAHAPWGVHDCSSYETAGVVCRTSKSNENSSLH